MDVVSTAREPLRRVANPSFDRAALDGRDRQQFGRHMTDPHARLTAWSPSAPAR